MAKSQSEIMGIAIIMVILTFGLLVFISFGLNKTSTPISLEYTYKQIPTLLNNAILETHSSEADCHGEKIQRILINVAEGNDFMCNDKRASVFIEESINNFLEETLGTWRMNYRYTVYTGSDFRDTSKYVLFLNNSNCIGMNVDTENFFFRLSDGRFLNIKLDLCY